MARYLISYTLKGKGTKYDCILKVFQQILADEETKPGEKTDGHRGMIRLDDSLYVLEVQRSRHTLEHLADLFRVCLDGDDSFLIARLGDEAIWRGHQGLESFLLPPK